jgi:hypothetical protein
MAKFRIMSSPTGLSFTGRDPGQSFIGECDSEDSALQLLDRNAREHLAVGNRFTIVDNETDRVVRTWSQPVRRN